MTTETAQPTSYAYGSPALPGSPVTEADLRLLEATVLWTDQDERYLRMAGGVLAPQVDAVLDLWYGYVGSHPHLVHYFSGPDGQPDTRYLEQVRARFGLWIRDLCERPRDQTWLDYQDEIARRHTSMKNRADGVESVPIIPLRYLVAFVYPITATIRDFLAARDHDPADVEAMHHSWFKSVVLTVTLWSRPYGEDRW
jgi:hypothetical protein